MPAPALVPRPRMEDRRLVLDDWYALPDDGNQYELFEGVLVLMAAPSFRHQEITLEVAVALRAAAATAGGRMALGPIGVGLDTNLGLLPDAVYLAPDRLHLVSARGIEGPPDIVVEVLSPSTRSFDRGAKLRAYLAAGVREVWLIDPAGHTVSVATAVGEQVVPFGCIVPSSVLSAGDAGLAPFAPPVA